MARLRRTAIGLALLITALFAWPAAPRPFDYEYFLSRLVDLDGLPKIEPGVRCKQDSSYDRAGRDPKHEDANGDTGKYLRIEPNGEAVMADIQGPGCIFRIWSADPQGQIRFYLDGDTKPTYEFTFHNMFLGDWGKQKVPPPIVYKRPGARAFDSYLPIPFARSCRVTADEAYVQYYHIQYKIYPPGTAVETFHLPFTPQENVVLQEVAAIWAAQGKNPQPPGPTARTVKDEVTLEPGKPTRIALLPGPAVVKAVRMKLVGRERDALRNTLLRVFWDDQREPDVDAPLGDFFGAPWGGVTYRSLPLGVTEDGFYCYYRMPYHWRALFTAENQGAQPATLRFEITYEPRDALPPDVGYFHAKWRREPDCAQFNYPFLWAWGQGKYVGVVMGVEHPSPGWWGEGDEKVRADGEAFPSIWGTGTEDFFGSAWGLHGDVREPLFGCNLDAGARTVAYRFQVADSVPFQKSFQMAIENYPPNDDDYFSVAYWYATRPNADFFPRYGGAEYTVKERAPWGRQFQGAFEFEKVFAGSLPAGARVVDDAALPAALSGRAGVDLGVRQQGDVMGPAPFRAPQSGAYYLLIYGLQGKEPPVAEVTVDGQALAAGQPDATQGLVAFGPAHLQAGRHLLALRFAAGASGVLDAFVLEPTYSVRAVEAELARVLKAEGGGHSVQQMMYPPSGQRSQAGAQLLFTPSAPGADVGLGFEVPSDGDYVVSAWMSTSYDYGIYQLAVDGEKIGQAFDLFSPNWMIAAKSASAPARLKAGKHRLDFIAVGKNDRSKGYCLGIDAFAVEPAH